MEIVLRIDADDEIRNLVARDKERSKTSRLATQKEMEEAFTEAIYAQIGQMMILNGSGCVESEVE